MLDSPVLVRVTPGHYGGRMMRDDEAALRRVAQRRSTATVVAAVGIAALSGCSLINADPSPTVTVATTATTTVTAEPSTAPDPTPSPAASDDAASDEFARPLWLGQVPLEIGAYDLGARAETPPELQDRQFEPREWLPDPETSEWFVEIGPVPEDVAARSSWVEGCPLPLSEMSYIVMPFWGFDGEVHTGEMIVNADHAEDVAGAFEEIFASQFPIEEMRVISLEEHLSPTTGDHNITSSFTCRRVVAANEYWSEHAYGLAVDINPFHNPFVKGEALFPELSEAYLDRGWDRPGMIHDPSDVYYAFAKIGWAWGGHWAGREDWMHFSANGG